MDKYYHEYKDDGDVKYCYPGTQVLVNKLDIHDGQQLSTVEREISIVKAAVLADNITGNFDLEHLKSIHKFLFDDIYEWAGKIRTVDIAKGNVFCLVQFIEMQFTELYEKLKRDNFLKNETDKEYVSKKIAYYLSELYVIHPFREGNGRTQRIYCQQLCMNTGKFYRLNEKVNSTFSYPLIFCGVYFYFLRCTFRDFCYIIPSYSIISCFSACERGI